MRRPAIRALVFGLAFFLAALAFNAYRAGGPTSGAVSSAVISAVLAAVIYLVVAWVVGRTRGRR